MVNINADRTVITKSKTKLFLISLITFIIIVIGFGILSLALGWTEFDFPSLFNQLFDFTLGLISFLTAFYLGQVYWDWKNKKEKSEILHKTALMYVNRIHSLALQALDLLEPVDGTKLSEINERRILLNNIYNEIGEICKVYVGVFGQLALIEDTKLIEIYFAKIQPVLSQLATCKHTQEDAKTKQVISALISVSQQFESILINQG